MHRVISFLLIILTIASLFVSCAVSEDANATNDGNTNPMKSPAPTESATLSDVTKSEETASEETESKDTSIPAETPVSAMTLDDAKLPTITSIKIRENDLTAKSPTDEELTNFVCEALFYYYTWVYISESMSCGWSVYQMPVSDWNVEFSSGGYGCEFDPEYVRSNSYFASVLNSYLASKKEILASHPERTVEGSSNSVYAWEKYNYSGDGTTTYFDPSLINIVRLTNNEQADAMDLDILLYAFHTDYYEDPPTETTSLITRTVRLVYEDGKWKFDVDLYTENNYQTQQPLEIFPRDDFGKRLTIEKAD